MNLPPDKVRLLRQYDNEKKWELICDQVRESVYMHSKFRRRVQESTQVLRELEISLRTNHIGWVREFLNEENKGLDVIVEYLSFAQYCSVRFIFSEHICNVFRSYTPWSRSIEDLHGDSNLPSPVSGSSIPRSTRHSIRSNTLPSRRTLKNSRLVCKKDDVHVCIMCLRAIMNYQYGFNMVMSHPHAVNEIALSLNNKNPRTKALVLELLAAVCLVRGGHEIILAAFDHFKEVKLNLFFEKTNVFFDLAVYRDASSQVHTLRRIVREKDETIQRQSTLEKKIHELERRGSLQIQVRGEGDGEGDVSPLPSPPQPMALSPCPDAMALAGACAGATTLFFFLTAVKIKKPIKTKFRMPVFNWVALKPNQINGTVFNEIDDERILEDLNVDEFEEMFKTKAQGPAVDMTMQKQKAPQKGPNKVSLLEANRAKNLAITLRKAGKSPEEICKAIQTFDLRTVPVDFVECLMRFMPTESEVKMLRQYERERRPMDGLTVEDRFMMLFSKIERLPQRMTIMAVMGNFNDSLQMLTPQLHAIIAASVSIKSSQKLKKILEIILALGNYMNSSKRGAVYGFKLQSLDLLLETKSTDRKQTLLHYIANVVKEKYPVVCVFYNELHYIEKAAAVSLENVLLDVKELQRGMDLTRREYSMHGHNSLLKDFIHHNEARLKKLLDDARIAQDAFDDVVKFFGESPKTMPPSVFFPVFVRFIKSYRQADEENEQKKRQEQLMMEKLLEQEAMMEEHENQQV
uniref:ADP-ribosylation factor-like protein 6-interacting protein 6 n=1 Tax=Sinocyclocheilus grahami TaxID=75366 RepID=A0A672M940_SINGR